MVLLDVVTGAEQRLRDQGDGGGIAEHRVKSLGKNFVEANRVS